MDRYSHWANERRIAAAVGAIDAIPTFTTALEQTPFDDWQLREPLARCFKVRALIVFDLAKFVGDLTLPLPNFPRFARSNIQRLADVQGEFLRFVSGTFDPDAPFTIEERTRGMLREIESIARDPILRADMFATSVAPATPQVPSEERSGVPAEVRDVLPGIFLSMMSAGPRLVASAILASPRALPRNELARIVRKAEDTVRDHVELLTSEWGFYHRRGVGYVGPDARVMWEIITRKSNETTGGN